MMGACHVENFGLSSCPKRRVQLQEAAALAVVVVQATIGLELPVSRIMRHCALSNQLQANTKFGF